jgi:hypothetical protein
MSHSAKPRAAAMLPVNPDSLLARIIERHSHLYIDMGMCIGSLVLVCCVVVGAHSLLDYLH